MKNTKKKPCKDCAKKKDNYGPLVIVAPQWCLQHTSFTKFVDAMRKEGAYVDVLITGHPTPPNCPPTNPDCKA